MSNPNFTGYVAFVAEKSLKKDFTVIWTTANPLLMLVKENNVNFNTSRQVEGNKMILPIDFADSATAADGVTDANQLTPITPYQTTGFTQAEFPYTHYRHAFYVTSAEEKLIRGGGVRGNLMGGKLRKLKDSFKLGVQNDMVSANNADRDKALGLRYVLSTLNSPGNISQVSYPVWAAGVKSGAGPFQTGLIDNEYDRINALGRGVADFVLLSHTATNNVYGKMRDQIAPAQVLQGPAKTAKYGFPTFEYLEMLCLQENKLGAALAGSAVVGRSGSWYVNMDSDEPVLDHVTPLEGTDADEYFYNWWMAIGCDDPASNSLITDIE